MALISRISQLFKADFHAVLDQVEEPHLLLKQAVREMEEELHAGEARQRRALAEREELQARQEELQRVLGDVDEELDICFDDGKTELARELVKRKLQTQRAGRGIANRLESLERALQEGKNILAEHRTALESARQKAELLRERESHAGSAHCLQNDVARNAGEFTVSDNDVEVALLRETKRRAVS